MPISLPLMTRLIDLIRHGVLRRAEAGAHAHVAVLGDGLVRFFGGCGSAGLALVFDGFHGVSVVEGAVSYCAHARAEDGGGRGRSAGTGEVLT
jgi:hypothetical protein